MGLDFSHTDAHWAYSGFMRFRIRIAATLGINLERMEGFTRDSNVSNPTSWDTIDDDIKVLLNHSDCDGELSPEECRKVAPRLREIVSPWPDDDFDKQQALLLADGMDKVAKNNEPLEFC
jgi:hypothetical protein